MKRLLGAICAALAVSIMVPSGLAQATAASTGTVKSIVFASQTHEIWLVNGDGTHLHQIAAAAGTTQGDPSFNPTGKQIAFNQGGDIWVVKAAGGTPRQLTHDGDLGGITWSPDGKWIAFVKGVDGYLDIFRVRATGGNAVRVTYGAPHRCISSEPAWSPDSASIAYERESDGNPSCLSLGLVVQRLGHPGSVVVTGFTSHPSFTPSGNLVYIALCPTECGDGLVGYESAPDGSNPHLVVDESGCEAHDVCLEDIIGAPPGGRGWISNDQFYDENDPISDATACFYGAYQKNGTVTQTMPQFCLGGVLAEGFDAA